MLRKIRLVLFHVFRLGSIYGFDSLHESQKNLKIMIRQIRAWEYLDFQGVTKVEVAKSWKMTASHAANEPLNAEKNLKPDLAEKGMSLAD